MNCYLCDKYVCDGNDPVGFVCICDRCIELWEKLEARMVNNASRCRNEHPPNQGMNEDQ